MASRYHTTSPELPHSPPSSNTSTTPASVSRIPASIITTNWRTPRTSRSPSERIVWSAWDGSTLRSAVTDTRQEAYHIAFILRHFLPSELVAIILHQSEHYESSSVRKNHEVAIQRHRSPAVYLVTPPIYCPARLQYPVVKVTFRIVARDYGLDLNVGRSHFTASILRSSVEDTTSTDSGLSIPAQQRSAEQAWTDTLLDAPELDLLSRSSQQQVLSDERTIALNTPASDMYETHVVEWDRENVEFVKGLRNGDRIAVKGWTQWASLENRISSVEVVIQTTTVQG